jgi:hypothetical protein
MNIKDWHPIQLGLFWVLMAAFGLPVWLGLSLLADFLTGRYPYQRWFESIPIALAFIVVFLVVGFGLIVTWRWLDSRPAEPAD